MTAATERPTTTAHVRGDSRAVDQLADAHLAIGSGGRMSDAQTQMRPRTDEAPAPRYDGGRRPLRSDQEAIQTLDDARLMLWALYRGSRLAWSICCKRWPELKNW